MLRTALFIPGAAALWSLLPLIAADSLGMGRAARPAARRGRVPAR
ncbi:hypothetical protein ACRAWF_06170 [Streptomyces sp. L7]